MTRISRIGLRSIGIFPMIRLTGKTKITGKMPVLLPETWVRDNAPFFVVRSCAGYTSTHPT